MKRLCFACDLIDNPDGIAAYKAYHAPGNAWPEITESITAAGILNMEIYLTGNRLFMIADVNDDFDPQKKAVMDKNNPRVQEWEALMSSFQQQLPWADAGEKWTPLQLIFELGK